MENLGRHLLHLVTIDLDQKPVEKKCSDRPCLRENRRIVSAPSRRLQSSLLISTDTACSDDQVVSRSNLARLDPWMTLPEEKIQRQAD